MPSTITVIDEFPSGGDAARFELEFPAETVTARELIRSRVYQEVDDYNRRVRSGTAPDYRGLVTPEEAGAPAARAGRQPPKREIDWKKQFDTACDAFQKNQIIVLVGERQVEGLDEVITLTRGLEVTFLKLTPLVGG